MWWPTAHHCARVDRDAVIRTWFAGDRPALGEALFEAMIIRRSGVIFIDEKDEDLWRLVSHPDGKVHLAIPEMFDWMARLDIAAVESDPAYPIMSIAGRRRHYNANQAIRDPCRNPIVDLHH
ncbi:hypothetical protein [Novosphingobium sp.]|uniref:hypothetical protein n=1 Tax=Novosphingobium sp. TaxID=1874826 RepID=UPI003BAAFBDD